MSSRYTVRSEPSIDAFIENHLETITQSLHKLLGKNLVAVVLAGGFGRGEGSVRVKSDGNMHVVNDYDIDVVFREQYGPGLSKIIAHLRYSRSLIHLADRLAALLDIKQVDLCLRGASSYSSGRPPLLADYDLKMGSILLYGETNPVGKMPEYAANEIPTYEGTWLLRNRGIGLLLARFYLQGGKLQADKKEYFNIEINKAIIAMGDALIIANGTYHHSYAKRALHINDVVTENVPHSKELVSLYVKAVQQKLIPQDDTDSDPAKLWGNINTIYCELFLYFESVRLTHNFENIADYVNMVLHTREKPSFKQRLKLVFENLRGTIEKDAAQIAHIKYSKNRTTALAFTLLQACSTDGYDINFIQLAYKVAGISMSSNSPESEWQRLARIYLLLIHPKGELGRVLRNS